MFHFTYSSRRARFADVMRSDPVRSDCYFCILSFKCSFQLVNRIESTINALRSYTSGKLGTNLRLGQVSLVLK